MDRIIVVFLILSLSGVIEGGFNFAATLAPGQDPAEALREELLRKISNLEQRIQNIKSGSAKTRIRRAINTPEETTETSVVEEDGPNLNPSSGGCYICPPGVRGRNGLKGLPGRDGRDGRDGWPSSQEDLCGEELNVSMSMDHVEEDFHVGSEEYGYSSQQEEQIPWRSKESGVTYIRWGRTTCAENSTLLYGGSAGGAAYNQKGGGKNYLCLPNQPVYKNPKAGAGGLRSYIYGAEYQTSDFPPLAGLNDFDVPCAVCLTTGANTMVMIPAINICPKGWKLEYAGYLMSEETNNAHRRTEFVCMDRDPEVIPRSGHSTDGILFYAAEVRCAASGSGLPCDRDSGGYIDGNELTCAVCTL